MRTKFLLAFGVVVILAGVCALAYQGRRVNYNIGYEPDQPIAFSHKLHAGENKIPCLYCHFAADQGRHAGIPPVELCMNCHTKVRKDSPEVAKIKDSLKSGKTIEWTKVNHYPDFAYFNHSQHVRVGNVQCQSCHGPVEEMTRLRQEKDLSMGMCISCHRENNVAPPNDHKSRAGGDCAKCHY